LRSLILSLSGSTGTTYGSYLSEGTMPTGSTPTIADCVTHGTMIQSDILNLQAAVWADGGTPNGYSYVLAPQAAKYATSQLFAPQSSTASSSIYRRDVGGMGDTTIDLTIDRVVTDHGELLLILDQAVYAAEMIGFDPEFFHINVLRDFEVIELAKTGPSKHGMVEAEMTCSLTAPVTGWVLQQVG